MRLAATKMVLTGYTRNCDVKKKGGNVYAHGKQGKRDNIGDISSLILIWGSAYDFQSSHQKKPKLILLTSLGPNTLAIYHPVPFREKTYQSTERENLQGGYSAQSLGHLSEVRILPPLSGISSHPSGSTESNPPDAMASIIADTPTTICWII